MAKILVVILTQKIGTPLLLVSSGLSLCVLCGERF